MWALFGFAFNIFIFSMDYKGLPYLHSYRAVIPIRVLAFSFNEYSFCFCCKKLYFYCFSERNQYFFLNPVLNINFEIFYAIIFNKYMVLFGALTFSSSPKQPENPINNTKIAKLLKNFLIQNLRKKYSLLFIENTCKAFDFLY